MTSGAASATADGGTPDGDGRRATAAVSADAMLPALTGLRFVAAAAVVIYHSDTFTALLPHAVDRVSRAGFAAVGLFYVLSGFLLSVRWSARFAAGTADTRGFLRARFARIAPLHLLGVAWSFVLFRVSDGSAGVLALPVAAALLGLHAWVPTFVFQTNVPSWSVSNEVFFYASFPILARYLVGAASRAGGRSSWSRGFSGSRRASGSSRIPRWTRRSSDSLPSRGCRSS